MKRSINLSTSAANNNNNSTATRLLAHEKRELLLAALPNIMAFAGSSACSSRTDSILIDRAYALQDRLIDEGNTPVADELLSTFLSADNKWDFICLWKTAKALAEQFYMDCDEADYDAWLLVSALNAKERSGCINGDTAELIRWYLRLEAGEKLVRQWLVDMPDVVRDIYRDAADYYGMPWPVGKIDAGYGMNNLPYLYESAEGEDEWDNGYRLYVPFDGSAPHGTPVVWHCVATYGNAVPESWDDVPAMEWDDTPAHEAMRPRLRKGVGLMSGKNGWPSGAGSLKARRAFKKWAK